MQALQRGQLQDGEDKETRLQVQRRETARKQQERVEVYDSLSCNGHIQANKVTAPSIQTRHRRHKTDEFISASVLVSVTRLSSGLDCWRASKDAMLVGS